MRTLVTQAFPVTGHRIIEASAGTGKTYTITNLYLRLLLGDQANHRRPLTVDSILVLTFTVAATEELRRRIRTRIQEARLALNDGESTDPFLHQLALEHGEEENAQRVLTAALQLMDEASIFTIHGFCARILGEYSFEADVLFNQNLNADREMLLRQAVEDCFRSEILGLPHEERTLALDLWPDPDSLEQAIAGYLFRANLQITPSFQDPSSVKDRLNADIAQVKTMWVRDNIPELLRNSDVHKGRPTIKRLEEFTAFCHSDDDNFDLWDYWTSAYIRKNLKKGGAMPDHPVFPKIDAIAENRRVFKQLVTANLWNRVIQVVRDRIDRFKAELGQLTLDDLLTQLRAALGRPETGLLLAEKLANRWPVAMVDEFQDTDDIQYEIFSRIYRREGSQSLLLIGDPKQAIYQFRGADVYTYITAKRQVHPEEDVYSLNTNWRSSRPLIDATNRLFDQPDVFLNDDDIPFVKVNPSETSNTRSFKLQGAEATPVTFWYFHGEDKLNKDEARELAMDCAAEEASRLLNLGAQGEALVDDRNLHAGQIAFLVRNRRDAREARSALRRRGIRSVYVTVDSVFSSDTANDLKLILQAVFEPANDHMLRAALASTLMQCTAAEIDNLNHNVIEHQDVLSEFRTYNQIWMNQGIAAMIESLIHTRRLGEKWLGHPEGERQLTNLRHLAELLQKRSIAMPGMHRLLKWFERERSNADDTSEAVNTEERQLRLESDENLVQIVTMHAAKGLEYDVVMIPMAGFRSRQYKGEPALFHDITDDGFQVMVDLNPSDESLKRARTEKLAEDIRLLYVAITRAKYKCYVGIPRIRELSDTALARLLNLPSGDNDSSRIGSYLEQNYEPPLFLTETISARSGVTAFSPDSDQKKLVAPPDLPRVYDRWRLHSYTSITRRLSDTDPGTEVRSPLPGFGDDEQQSMVFPDREFSRFTFPRGPCVGIALHSLLEKMDFRQRGESLTIACKRTLNHLGIHTKTNAWLDVLYYWISDILETKLSASNGFALADIDNNHRFAELEFHFPLTPRRNIGGLIKNFGYLQDEDELYTADLTGMMTGVIDLVVEHKDQFYLLDYKSNYLGNKPTDYESGRLQEIIRAHHYDLQYLIYCVALNRYLATRIPAYEYDRHFGGVMYLFLRGMNGQEHAGSGVFFDRPDVRLITQLDQALRGSS